jgi:hypothetical protein
LEKSHRAAPAITAAPLSGAPPAPAPSLKSAALAIVLISLIVYMIVLAGHLNSTPPVVLAPPAPATATPAKAAARAAEAASAIETKQALLGDARIRHAVHNASTLKYLDIVVMPQGAVCYQFELTNSRGVKYPGAAVLDRGSLKTSAEGGFTTLWANRCARSKSARSVTHTFSSGLPRG